MPIQRVERLHDRSGTEIGICLHGANSARSVQVLYADVPGSTWDRARLAAFTSQMQAAIDQRIRLTDDRLTDDPAKDTDPRRPDFFHDGGDLVSRSVIFSDAIWDGSQMSFRVSRARR